MVTRLTAIYLSRNSVAYCPSSTKYARSNYSCIISRSCVIIPCACNSHESGDSSLEVTMNARFI